jgi:hypothetical protein
MRRYIPYAPAVRCALYFWEESFCRLLYGTLSVQWGLVGYSHGRPHSPVGLSAPNLQGILLLAFSLVKMKNILHFCSFTQQESPDTYSGNKKRCFFLYQCVRVKYVHDSVPGARTMMNIYVRLAGGKTVRSVCPVWSEGTGFDFRLAQVPVLLRNDALLIRPAVVSWCILSPELFIFSSDPSVPFVKFYDSLALYLSRLSYNKCISFLPLLFCNIQGCVYWSKNHHPHPP